MNIENLLINLIPNLSMQEASQINVIINSVYGICIALMIISLIYYTGQLFWKIHHSNNEDEIKYLKKHYLKRIIGFICFLLLFVILGVILDVLSPLIKDDTN